MPRKRAVMTDAERAELPSSLFILSGTNFVRRAAVWLSRWILFEWIIILTIIGKPKYSFSSGVNRRWIFLAVAEAVAVGSKNSAF